MLIELSSSLIWLARNSTRLYRIYKTFASRDFISPDLQSPNPKSLFFHRSGLFSLHSLPDFPDLISFSVLFSPSLQSTLYNLHLFSLSSPISGSLFLHVDRVCRLLNFESSTTKRRRRVKSWTQQTPTGLPQVLFSFFFRITFLFAQNLPICVFFWHFPSR